MRRLFTLFLILFVFPFPALCEPADLPSAFGEWYLSQEWTEEERYAWASVFGALTDGINRHPEATAPIVTPAYVAIISGKAYHTASSCSGLRTAHKVVEMDASEAAERGFTPCRICNK